MSAPTANATVPTYAIDGLALVDFVKQANDEAVTVIRNSSVVQQQRQNGRPNSSALSDPEATIRSAGLWTGALKETVVNSDEKQFRFFGERIREAINIIKST